MKRAIRHTESTAAARGRKSGRSVVLMVGSKPLRISASTIEQGARHGIDVVGAGQALAGLHDIQKRRGRSATSRVVDGCWHAPKS